MHRFAVVVAVLAFSSPLLAQELESIAGMRLRFEAPGARAAGMGGASEALTDSFNAIMNPASLARQTTRVAAIEARHTSSETPYATGGTLGALQHSSFETGGSGIGSAIVVLPGRRATWAFYYDEPMRLSSDTRGIAASEELITVGVRDETLIPSTDCEVPENAPPTCYFARFMNPAVVRGRADLTLRRYGAATATAFGRLAVGGAVQFAQLEDEIHADGTSQRDSGGRFTWTAGSQLAISPRFRAGASYRSSGKYATERRTYAYDPATPLEPYLTMVPSAVATPSSYGAGVAAEVTPNLTFAADARRVNYSEIMEPSIVSFVSGNSGPRDYEIPDVTELRAGLEYRLSTRIPVALRAGWWHEPAHRAQATGPGVIPQMLNAVMLLDSDERHVTAGIGIGQRVRLDAAIDRSERTTRASLGVATTF